MDDLRPGRAYRLRARAANARGAGPWSGEASAATSAAPPDAPADVTTSQRTAMSLRVKWAPPAEENGAAVLRYRRVRAPWPVYRGFHLPALSAEPRHMRLQCATSCNTDLVTSCLQICSYLHLKFSQL